MRPLDWMMAELGAVVYKSHQGEEAWECLGEGKPQLVVAEWDPVAEPEGSRLARTIKRGRAQTQVLLLALRVPERGLAALGTHGGDGVLLMPAHVDELLAHAATSLEDVAAARCLLWGLREQVRAIREGR